jgi:DNA-binding transcriptional regulator YdaS (Cro superfamily)
MGPDLLRAYLARSKQSQRAFCRRIGSSLTLVTRYLSGARTPAGEWAFAIERATSGAVPASSWWSSATNKPRPAA